MEYEDLLISFIKRYKKRGAKINNNPKGFNKINSSVEMVIFRGSSANNKIKKYKNAVIPKIRKKKSALMTHSNIKIKKMKNTES